VFIGQKWLLKDSDLRQLYCLDVLTDPGVWERKHLRFDKTVGYFEGRRGRVDLYSEDTSVELPWDEYRKILDRVEGLTVVDIPAIDDPKYHDAVWKQVQKYNLQYLVVNHIVEYGGFSRMAAKVSPGRSDVLPELMLEALRNLSATSNEVHPSSWRRLRMFRDLMVQVPYEVLK
jgi:hypothetical protein